MDVCSPGAGLRVAWSNCKPLLSYKMMTTADVQEELGRIMQNSFMVSHQVSTNLLGE